MKIEQALRATLERKIADDLVSAVEGSRSRSFAGQLTGVHTRMRAEASQLGRDAASGDPLSPFQQHIRAKIAEYEPRVDALIGALGDPTDANSMQSSVVDLFGQLIGYVLALEARVAALEITLDAN